VSEKDGEYTISYRCKNCGRAFIEKITRGVQAPELSECPNCGCYAGEKRWPIIPGDQGGGGE
jgi:DNA-directed RNA polymerase subunit RPC12/RpoP